jgi:Flp pilus assembly protein TadG
MRLRSITTDPNRRGVAATELALWLPFLGLMFVIALDFCRVFHASQTIQNCALAGAMYSSGVSTGKPGSPSDNPAVLAAIAEGASLDPPLGADNVAVVTSNGKAEVTVTYDYRMLVNWTGIAGTWKITRTVSMNIMPASGT